MTLRGSLQPIAETIDNASDRPVMFLVLARDPLWRETPQTEILGLHGLYDTYLERDFQGVVLELVGVG
jgi:hypothetical protein